MKSSLTTLLQLSKGAIHLNTSVAAKGPDHIFFILSQHLYDMQLEMLLACKYANPTKAELQTHSRAQKSQYIEHRSGPST